MQARNAAREQLDTSDSVLNALDELGEIMTDMLAKQQETEVRTVASFVRVLTRRQDDFEDILDRLQQRLLVIEDLHHRFVLYQASFHKLLLEIARRRLYREAAERIVDGMTRQLTSMAEGKSVLSALVRLAEYA